jgi:hypothetical protein
MEGEMFFLSFLLETYRNSKRTAIWTKEWYS